MHSLVFNESKELFTSSSNPQKLFMYSRKFMYSRYNILSYLCISENIQTYQPIKDK